MARISTWVDDRLAEVGGERTGGLEMPHVTPWSAVFTVRTSIGRVWLKVPARDNRFEAAIYHTLLKTAPDNVLTPIASNSDSGWLLLPDGGPPLAETARGSDLVDAMCIALPQYGRLQLSTITQSEEMLSLGVGDLLPQGLADRFERAVGEINPRPKPLVGLIPSFAAWCQQLIDSPLPPTLDHNDLHPWNILGLDPGRPDARTAVFYDWGDSVVAHPFGSSLEPISRVRRLARLAPDHPDVMRMRDSYLEAFDGIMTRSESVALIEIAWRVAKAARPIVWGGTPEEVQRYINDVARGDLSL